MNSEAHPEQHAPTRLRTATTSPQSQRFEPTIPETSTHPQRTVSQAAPTHGSRPTPDSTTSHYNHRTAPQQAACSSHLPAQQYQEMIGLGLRQKAWAKSASRTTASQQQTTSSSHAVRTLARPLPRQATPSTRTISGSHRSRTR